MLHLGRQSSLNHKDCCVMVEQQVYLYVVLNLIPSCEREEERGEIKHIDTTCGLRSHHAAGCWKLEDYAGVSITAGFSCIMVITKGRLQTRGSHRILRQTDIGLWAILLFLLLLKLLF